MLRRGSPCGTVVKMRMVAVLVGGVTSEPGAQGVVGAGVWLGGREGMNVGQDGDGRALSLPSV